MKFFSHYSVSMLANTYLIGPDGPGDALIVDPGAMDVPLLELIEGNEYYLRYVLITHPDETHARGVKTIRKIYDASIYAAVSSVYSFPCNRLYDGDTERVGEFTVQAIGMPSHLRETMIYAINGLLFTGNTLSAGIVGDIENNYTKTMLQQTLSTALEPLPDSMPVFPSYGPPTTLGIERSTNPQLIGHPDSEEYAT